tara:strand:+ start:237 stop:350 length:114 start_codon:yes stop_codon:yes gene_type:complete
VQVEQLEQVHQQVVKVELQLFQQFHLLVEAVEQVLVQ